MPTAQEFSGMPQLQFLDVSDNSITSFAAGAFVGLVALEIVAISNNPIVCNVCGYSSPTNMAVETAPSVLVQCTGCQSDFKVPYKSSCQSM